MIFLKVSIDTTDSVPRYQYFCVICKDDRYYLSATVTKTCKESTLVLSACLTQQKGCLQKMVSCSQLGEIMKYQNDFVS